MKSAALAPWRLSVECLFLTLLITSGCAPVDPLVPYSPTTRPTTQPVIPWDMVILATGDGFDQEVEVREAGPYRLYASNLPGHVLATARLQAGGILRFRQRGEDFIEADYQTGRQWGTFSLPIQEGVEYFWVRGVWNP